MDKHGPVDLVGQVFGRLRVVARADDHHTPSGQKLVMWACACDCGASHRVSARHLRSGHTRSCGCKRHDNTASVSHGHTRGRGASREYRTWCDMVKRCHDPTSGSYRFYGERGTRVCDEWRGPGGFERFYAHIGGKPSATHQIDRIDNAKGYEPGNVRWVTPREQQRNRTNNRWLTAFGRTMCMSDWSREIGIRESVIHRRLARGWTTEETFTKPLRQTKRAA